MLGRFRDETRFHGQAGGHGRFGDPLPGDREPGAEAGTAKIRAHPASRPLPLYPAPSTVHRHSPPDPHSLQTLKAWKGLETKIQCISAMIRSRLETRTIYARRKTDIAPIFQTLRISPAALFRALEWPA